MELVYERIADHFMYYNPTPVPLATVPKKCENRLFAYLK